MEKVNSLIRTNYLVPQGTTHVMMWFGGVLPDKRMIRYRPGQKLQYQAYRDNENKHVYVNYVETLKGECKKMEQKGEACILVYDSKMIDDAGKQKMKDIVKDIPNCYLVDFEDFLQTALKNNIQFESGKQFLYDHEITQIAKSKKISDFIEHLKTLIESNKDNMKFTSLISRDCVGNLVDCARMLLLLNPSKLKRLAIDSNKEDKKTIKPKTDDFSLLYHDFDMIQKTSICTAHNNEPPKNIPDVKHRNYLMFTDGCMDYSCGVIENGIIFVNSLNDRNIEIENMIHKYISYEDNDVNDGNNAISSKQHKGFKKSPCTMYDGIIFTDCKYINTFSYQYQDEGHRAWWVQDMQLDNKQSTNNNEPQHKLKQQSDKTIKKQP